MIGVMRDDRDVVVGDAGCEEMSSVSLAGRGRGTALQAGMGAEADAEVEPHETRPVTVTSSEDSLMTLTTGLKLLTAFIRLVERRRGCVVRLFRSHSVEATGMDAHGEGLLGANGIDNLPNTLHGRVTEPLH